MYNLEISLLGGDLPIGLSRGGLECPACHGGHTHERSLSITRLSHALAWKCHRASCGVAGYTATDALHHGGFVAEAKRLERNDQFIYERLPKEKEVYLETRYGVPKTTLDFFRVRYHRASDSFAYPVYSDSVYLQEVGYHLRGPNKKITSEVFTKDFARGGFYSRRGEGRESDTIIFVEDPVSALKVSELYDTFCLFGTHLNWEKVCSVVNENYPYALLHLDWDARAKSLQYQRDYGMFFKTLRPVFSLKDPKDLTIPQLRSFYGSIVDWSGHQEPHGLA